MIYHVVVGDMAAKPLLEAVAAEDSLNGEVLILRDLLNVGPLIPEEGQSFSAMRTQFWAKVAGAHHPVQEVDDLERILQVGNELSKNQTATIWFWMSPLPADVCAYYWLLHYLRKYAHRMLVVNIAGLPFLDDQGKLFFPKSLSEIMAKELLKARKLARNLTTSEMEIDGDEWQRLREENAALRTAEGGKKIVGRAVDYYDEKITNVATLQSMKASRLVHQAMSKNFLPVGDMYLAWRIKEMISSDVLQSNSDLSKPLKEIMVSLPGGTLFADPLPEEN